MKLDEFLAAPAAELSLPVEHLSASSIGMWMRCREQFRQRYVLGRKERPGASLVFGTGFHYAQETNFLRKIATGEDIPVSEVVEAYHYGWDTEVEKYGGVGEIEWDKNEKPDTTRKKGELLAVQYREAVAPKMQPITVEDWFELELEGVPVKVVGKIDFTGGLQAAPRPDSDTFDVSVVDYKTASRTQRELKPDWRVQAGLYQKATLLPVEYHVAVKTKEPAIITPVDAPGLRLEMSQLRVATTEKLIRQVAQEMGFFWTQYGPDVEWSGATTHPWACGFCGYRGDCAWWAE